MYNIIHPLIIHTLVFSPAKTSSLCGVVRDIEITSSSCLVRLAYSIIASSSQFRVTLLTIWRTVYFSSHLEDDLFLIKRRIMKFFERHVRHMRAADSKLIHNFPPPYKNWNFENNMCGQPCQLLTVVGLWIMDYLKGFLHRKLTFDML